MNYEGKMKNNVDWTCMAENVHNDKTSNIAKDSI